MGFNIKKKIEIENKIKDFNKGIVFYPNELRELLGISKRTWFWDCSLFRKYFIKLNDGTYQKR